MSEVLLAARGVTKIYRMGRSPLKVLAGCDLDVRPGEFVAIMGKSGSGKSTLLHILGALDTADGGEVTFAGQPVHTQSRGASTARDVDGVLAWLQRVLTVLLIVWTPLAFIVFIALPVLGLLVPALHAPRFVSIHLVTAAALLGALGVLGGLLLLILFTRLFLLQAVERRRTYLRRRLFGFVFQFYHLLPELNVLENVMLTARVGASTLAWPGRRHAARELALAILQRVGLSERLRHLPSELSGGERQRVAIARALLHKPRILFADEPTGNLDAAAGASLMGLLKELHGEGQTIVMVTHDPGIAAQADRIVRLEEGRLRAV
jgi:ABC-type lipoprotein export system ATPase subunit